METTGERRGQACVGLLVLGQQRKRWLCQRVRRHDDYRRVPWDCRASGVVWQLPTLLPASCGRFLLDVGAAAVCGRALDGMQKKQHAQAEVLCRAVK
jgi:hypothetical protein